MKHIRLFSFVLSTISVMSVSADEGMWLLPEISQQNIQQMKGLGLELSAEDIYHPDSVSLKDAVVIFGSGCTGEVISPEGLVLTNHHCGYNYIQKHSSVENDLLTDGFFAKSRDEELSNPGLNVTFIDRIDDVTEYVQNKLAKDTASFVRNYLSNSYLNKLAEEKVGPDFLKQHPGTSVIIKPFYGGNRYYMFTQKVYSDIRMVAAPPSSIGQFGIDTDNWMWPRHSGDFSLFRIYTDSLGNPAPYSESNIPLKPKKYFDISLNGIRENDYVMLMGFPGRTNRFYTPNEVVERRDIENKIRVETRDHRQTLMLEEMLADPQIKIQYAGKYAGSTNSYKSSKGMNKMIDQQQLVALKQLQQQSLFNWASQNNHPEYIAAAHTIDSVIEARAALKTRQQYLDEALSRSVEFAKVPTINDSLIIAINGKDKELLSREMVKFEKRYQGFHNKDYAPAVDRKISKAMLKLYADRVGKSDRPTFFSVIEKKYKGNIDLYVDALFAQSIYGNPEQYKRFIASPSVKSLNNDGMIFFARSIKEEQDKLKKELSAYDDKIEAAHKIYIRGLMEMNANKPNYPDANFTIRMTYGQITPLEPSDGIIYKYETTMDGVLEKEDSTNWEYHVSARLKELYHKKDFGNYSLKNGKMPVDFIANTHTTGGNSGSPVLNSKGELVGIGFDRNWEGISGDIQYQKKYQRTICADIRYILFVIEKLGNAGYLIDEMSIKQ